MYISSIYQKRLVELHSEVRCCRADRQRFHTAQQQRKYILNSRCEIYHPGKSNFPLGNEKAAQQWLHLTAFGSGLHRATRQFSCYDELGVLSILAAGEPHCSFGRFAPNERGTTAIAELHRRGRS